MHQHHTALNVAAHGRLLGLFFACLVWVALGRAQTFTVSSTASAISVPLLGQGFTPSIAGPQGTGSSGSGATVFLQTFNFSYTDTLFASTLRIYSSLPALATDVVNGLGAGLVGSSISQSGGTYTFNNLALDRTTPYFALLTSVGNINTTLGTDPYAGGDAVNVSGLGAPVTLSLQDAAFTGTFTPTAVPEPATTVAWLGFAALIGAFIHRRIGGRDSLQRTVVP